MGTNEWTIKTLSECTLKEANDLWNAGFSGYYFDMSRNERQNVIYMGSASIDPTLSVAAFADGQPAGFVFNGVKMAHGRTTAWNGGTGVAPQCRGKGVAKLIMEESVRLLREGGVDHVTLEVVSHNIGALKAYEKAGFQIVDDIIGMKHEGAFVQAPFNRTGETLEQYTTTIHHPAYASSLPFYRSQVAWMTQWYNWSNGEAMVIHNRAGDAVAYVMRRCSYNEHGVLTSITVSHCEVEPSQTDKANIVRYALQQAYGPMDMSIERNTENLSQSSKEAVDALREAGFETVYEQKLMMIDFAAERELPLNS